VELKSAGLTEEVRMQHSSNWIDVSVPLRSGMVHWPGDPEPSFERISDIATGAEVNVTLCRMTAHTGTHMDAPCHFLPGEADGIDQFPLETGVGPAKVIEVRHTADKVTAEELVGKGIARGDRILLKTRNSSQRWFDSDFNRGFVGLDHSAAEILADSGVQLIGVDYLSVGVFQGDGAATHRTLLKAGVWIVEGLFLAGIRSGEYDVICLPLRLLGADGSPARVLIRSRG
jgi:arylformamidase